MKPLIRQFIYDKLRRSLYKHEIKEKVCNNPYFPFNNQEDIDHFLNHCIVGGVDRQRLIETIERIKAHPDYIKSTQESYETFLNNQRKLLINSDTTDTMNNYYDIALRFLGQDFLIWDMLEERYGKPNL